MDKEGNRMTWLRQIKKRVEELEADHHDDEVAHSIEDSIRHDALEAIAFGAASPRDIARVALRTSKLDFSRWSA